MNSWRTVNSLTKIAHIIDLRLEVIKRRQFQDSNVIAKLTRQAGEDHSSADPYLDGTLDDDLGGREASKQTVLFPWSSRRHIKESIQG